MLFLRLCISRCPFCECLAIIEGLAYEMQRCRNYCSFSERWMQVSPDGFMCTIFLNIQTATIPYLHKREFRSCVHIWLFSCEIPKLIMIHIFGKKLANFPFPSEDSSPATFTSALFTFFITQKPKI